MLSTPDEFARNLAVPMGFYYLIAAVMNGWAAVGAWLKKRRASSAGWLLVAIGFGALGAMAFRGTPLEVPDGIKRSLDAVCSPASLTSVAFAGMLLLFFGRVFFVKPAVAWLGFNGFLLFFGASLTDPNFYALVMRPDDIPLVGMVVALGFFLWLAFSQAVENDRRSENQLPPIEAEYAERVLVWPDLVYSELIALVAASALLLVWAMILPAPLESPANPSLTPNPSKAPWYFVGLQELLTYSDAWNVGVLVPLCIVLGLMAIPYLDRSRSGSGYYSLRGRKFAVGVFLFGFLILWILPILIGSFLRGPSWSSFGWYEMRDPSKMPPLVSRTLFFPFEGFGTALVILYFAALPPLLGYSVCKRIRQSLGSIRFYLMIVLFLYMLTLPIKMILHWTFGIDSILG